MTLKELEKLAERQRKLKIKMPDDTPLPKIVLKLISAIKVMQSATNSLANERWVEACGCCSRPAKGKANIVARETMEAVNRILEDL